MVEGYDTEFQTSNKVPFRDRRKQADIEYHAVHDADYRQSKKDFDAFVEKMTERLTEIDETIPELPPKDLVSTLILTLRNAIA